MLIILWVNVIFMYIKRISLESMNDLIVSRLLFRLNFVTECHNLSCSISIFHVLIQLGWVLKNDSISFVWKLYYNYPFLINANYLYYDVLPFNCTRKMVKYAPNNIPMNIIGLDQTSRKILEDGDILIFLVVLINLTRKVYPKATWNS